jgi:PST family polysaccharide transporter
MDIYNGVRWNAAATWATQLMQFGVSIVLARLLLPQDYGVLAMATVMLGFLNLFRTMGFGAVIVQRPELSDSLLSSLFYVNFAVACGLALLAVAAAPVCNWIYQDPRVGMIMAVMGITFVFTASAVVPAALLTRQMRFDRLAIARVAEVPVSGVTAISLAFAGYGVWSLVVGSIAGTLINIVLIHALCPWHPRLLFRWSDVRSVFRFGANVTGFNFFNYFASNTDQAIIGASLGAGPLGLYSLARGIMGRPCAAVTEVIGSVLFPVLARMQHDDARLKAAYLRACGAIAFVTFPMMLGLVAVAHPFVEVLLGEKWLPAVPLIVILTLLGAIETVGQTAKRLLLAKGRSDWYFRLGAITSVTYVCCFFAGLPWGVTGVAVSYLITGSAMNVFGLWIAFNGVSQLTLRDLAAELRPYATHAAVMAVMVVGSRVGMEMAHLDPRISLVLSIMIGIAVYGVLAFMTRVSALLDFLTLVPGQYAARLRTSLTN